MFSRSVLGVVLVLCVYLHADPIIQCSPASKNWPSDKSSIECGVLVSAISDLPKRVNPYKMVLMLELSDDTDPVVQNDIVSASKAVVERLMDGDLLSIVTLGNGASTLTKMQYVSSSSKDASKRTLASVNKGGEPDFSKGFDLAFEELSSIKGKRFAGSGILVITSSSPQNPEALAERVKEQAAEKKTSVQAQEVLQTM